MLMTSDIRGGTVFKAGNDVVVVQRMLGIKGGRNGQVKRLRVKSILTGQTAELGLDMGEKFEDVQLDYHKMKLSYVDGETWVFMDQESFEQYELTKDDLGDIAGYMTPEDDFEVEVAFYEGKPVSVTLPTAIVRTITYCEPGIKGDTSGKSTKPATLDTGIEVAVPLFCDIGTKIMFDTRDGTFIERAK
ncbi:MAG: elongation factor P [Rectinemataceae bacterium]